MAGHGLNNNLGAGGCVCRWYFRSGFLKYLNRQFESGAGEKVRDGGGIKFRQTGGPIHQISVNGGWRVENWMCDVCPIQLGPLQLDHLVSGSPKGRT